MKKILALLICLSSLAAIAQPKKVISNGRIAMKTKLVVDSLYIVTSSGDTINVAESVNLGFGLAFEDGELVLDSADADLKAFIAAYGGGEGGGGSGIQPSDTAAMLAGYTRVNRFLDSLSNHWTAILNRVTSTRFTDSISTLRTLANTKIQTISAGYSGTKLTVIGSNGSSAEFDGPTSSNAGVFTSALYNYFFTVGSATWGAGIVSVSALNQKHNITISSSGGRTLAFAFLDAGEVIAMHIDNTSGGTITLTLPTNSFVQNPTTGEYTSAASVSIVTGKSSLYLSRYDGTDYWFVY